MTIASMLFFLAVACCILASTQLLAMRPSRTSSSHEIQSYDEGFWGRCGCDFLRYLGYDCEPANTRSTTRVSQSSPGPTRTSPSGQTRVTNGGGASTTRPSSRTQAVLSTTPTGIFQSSTPTGPCGQSRVLAATAAATVNNTASQSLSQISAAAAGLAKNDAIVSDATSRIEAAENDAQTAMDSAVNIAETACAAAGADQTAINAANAAAVTAINAAQAAAATSITAARDAAITAIQAN
ncbi:hypothetical protein DdX_12913 [Ditylenchus destructor]|uniref:Uncharacterized protein n=1 Tax=Ditylenchus destructor TaxID=166010 RepID=A0AAD4MXI9_9BILA|nr:hypothetical protein DdX_12913 [Ditylenchus destructor]